MLYLCHTLSAHGIFVTVCEDDPLALDGGYRSEIHQYSLVDTHESDGRKLFLGIGYLASYLQLLVTAVVEYNVDP